MKELSTHLNRDKKNDDPLELILEPWGVWRQWGVDGLSSKRKSPLEGYNSLERAYTDQIDRRRKKVLSLTEYKIMRLRIEQLSMPKETLSTKPVSPNYGGHQFYSKIDRILSGIYGPYYNILIRKYEDLWGVREFITHNGWTETIAWNQISRARRAAKKELKKNGIRA